MAVEYAMHNGIATITLDSPTNRNALSAALVTSVSEHLAVAASDAGARAIVLAHTGGTFCAGADLTEAAAEGGPLPGTRRFITLLRQMIEHPKPIVARVDGHVRAGGLGLLGACDVVLAGDKSTFAFTETRLGVAPAIISLTLLPVLQARAASRYLLTGSVFDAAEAAEIGLVTMAAADLDGALASELAALRLCAPGGLAATKRLLTRAVRQRFEDAADHMATLSAELFAGPEAQEGIAAFGRKQPPEWAL